MGTRYAPGRPLSASSYDVCNQCGAQKCPSCGASVNTPYKVQTKSPNPDPKRFEILTHLSLVCGLYLVVRIRYEGCTTFEGEKILVYRGVSFENLKCQGSLDPHFSENTKFHSPIARFVPTTEGWDMAVAFVFAWHNAQHNRS